jgi:regulator of sigma E protease
LCLLALTLDWAFLWVCLQVAIALGLVIFVHELGHFVVAKLCGVKCEKFYLGFDIYGLRLFRFRWGETEYGIGILPLGGYVKMLGQEDNPARIREELERAKQAQREIAADLALPSATVVEPTPGDSTAEAEPPLERLLEQAAAQTTAQFTTEAEPPVTFDPRSLPAQSVPKRMAIFSAGVVMNVLFAWLCAAFAHHLGVRQLAPVIGWVWPGGPAWEADIRVGDRVEKINGQPTERFADVLKGVSLGDNIKDGLEIVIRRGDEGKLLTKTVHPRMLLRPMIGVGPSYTTMLADEDPPVVPGSPAAQASVSFCPKDWIVAIDGQSVATYADVVAAFARNTERPMKITVERAVGAVPEPAEDAKPSEKAAQPQPLVKRIEVIVPPRRMRHFGIEMTMGEIRAVQVDSPAAAAGLQPGDVIIEVDGQPAGDPLTLPNRLRHRAGEQISLKVRRPVKAEHGEAEQQEAGHRVAEHGESHWGSRRREGGYQELVVPVFLRQASWYEQPAAEGNPTSIPHLGVAYRVLHKVAAVAKGGPAERAGIRPGDVVRRATILPPDPEMLKDRQLKQRERTVKFGNNLNWPALMYAFQTTFPGSRLQLELARDGELREVTLEPIETEDWFFPDRGLLLAYDEFCQVAESVVEALRLGGEETVEALLMVVSVLRKLGSQISVRGLGGPIEIAKAAGRAASQGMAELLLFCCLLSANLAVLNFLPIPLLDGGHMLFLLWELIRGKPADERVQMVLTYFGLVFILALMFLVLGLDIGLISRDVPLD